MIDLILKYQSVISVVKKKVEVEFGYLPEIAIIIDDRKYNINQKIIKFLYKVKENDKNIEEKYKTKLNLDINNDEILIRIKKN
jgi:hypothetical protein